jgi:hypothetical protein
MAGHPIPSRGLAVLKCSLWSALMPDDILCLLIDRETLTTKRMSLAEACNIMNISVQDGLWAIAQSGRVSTDKFLAIPDDD